MRRTWVLVGAAAAAGCLSGGDVLEGWHRGTRMTRAGRGLGYLCRAAAGGAAAQRLRHPCRSHLGDRAPDQHQHPGTDASRAGAARADQHPRRFSTYSPIWCASPGASISRGCSSTSATTMRPTTLSMSSTSIPSLTTTGSACGSTSTTAVSDSPRAHRQLLHQRPTPRGHESPVRERGRDRPRWQRCARCERRQRRRRRLGSCQHLGDLSR